MKVPEKYWEGTMKVLKKDLANNHESTGKMSEEYWERMYVENTGKVTPNQIQVGPKLSKLNLKLSSKDGIQLFTYLCISNLLNIIITQIYMLEINLLQGIHRKLYLF